MPHHRAQPRQENSQTLRNLSKACSHTLARGFVAGGIQTCLYLRSEHTLQSPLKRFMAGIAASP